jgi:hypothetical protein
VPPNRVTRFDRTVACEHSSREAASGLPARSAPGDLPPDQTHNHEDAVVRMLGARPPRFGVLRQAHRGSSESASDNG